MRSTFELTDTIHLAIGEVNYDLHNCFDFVGLEYRPTDRKARLEWQRGDGHWVPDETPAKLIMIFKGVSNFAVNRRGPEMPFTEDSCVSSISFLPPDFSDDFAAICPEFRSADEHLSIEFQSGAGIKIWAESVTHEIA